MYCHCAGNGSAEVAYRAQQLLEHSLLSELRAIVARALSGLDMFAGNQLSELDLLGSDFMETAPQENVRAISQHPCTVYLPGLSTRRGRLFGCMSCKVDSLGGSDLTQRAILGSDFMETAHQENVRGHLSAN